MGGVIIHDGTVVWIVDDLRDGTPVGAVRGSLYLPAGYIKCNGAIVQRGDYPRLVALADKHNLWTDDVTANAGLFGRGDSVATMVLPNWIDRIVQLEGDNAGTSVAAGLPNITGDIGSFDDYGIVATEAFYTKSRPMADWQANTQYSGYIVSFDASRSNQIYGASATVQPAAIKLLPIIRY